MTTNTPERFREVEPLTYNSLKSVAAEYDSPRYIFLVGGFLTIAKARALRDWLNKVLPEEKP